MATPRHEAGISCVSAVACDLRDRGVEDASLRCGGRPPLSPWGATYGLASCVRRDSQGKIAIAKLNAELFAAMHSLAVPDTRR